MTRFATKKETINGKDETHPVMPGGVKAAIDARVIDEDDMASDSDRDVPTQQSVAAFVGCEKIESGTVSSASSLDITDLSSDYRAYLLVFDDLVAATDGVELWMRTDADNGASFESGASDYAFVRNVTVGGDTDSNTPVGNDSTTEIPLTSAGIGNNATTNECVGWITIHNPMSSGDRTKITYQMTVFSSGNDLQSYYGGGQRNNAEANNAIQLLMSSGNIASMNYTLYGYN